MDSLFLSKKIPRQIITETLKVFKVRVLPISCLVTTRKKKHIIHLNKKKLVKGFEMTEKTHSLNYLHKISNFSRTYLSGGAILTPPVIIVFFFFFLSHFFIQI